MIKKDVRYIIKRIVIGVGIVLVLSCLNGCKVKALTLFSGVEVPDADNIVGNNAYYISWYNSDELRLLYQPSNVNNLYLSSKGNWLGSSRIYSLPITTNGNNISVKPNAKWTYKGTISNDYGITYFSDEIQLACLNYYFTNSGTCSQNALHPYHSYFNNNILRSNGEVAKNISLFSAYLPSQAPSFLSFNAIPITTNNVITSYTVQPEFSSFDTDNYVYQYSFDKNRWLSLTENKQILRINNNSTIYVRIKDKNTNEYIDGSTFTITNIGTFYNQQTYNINFSGDYRTQNYLTDNMCVFEGSKSEIKEYQIYIDYLPKSSILKYQYQYVPTDSQLNNNNWLNVSSSDNGAFTYVASENGTLYARILDKENNVLKSSTFQVSSIGKIAIDDIDKQCTKNIFQKFSSEINYGGPASVIFKIPVDLLSSLYNTASTSNTCHPYVISELMGTNFTLPCFDLKAQFGSTIYTEIDAMLCFILSIMFFKFLLKIYNDFISMKDIN